MSTTELFTPRYSISLAATTSPQTIALAALDQGDNVNLRFVNAGANPVCYATGPTAVAAAAAAVTSAWALNSTPLMPNAIEIFTKPLGDNFIGYVATASTSTVYVSTGTGQ